MKMVTMSVDTLCNMSVDKPYDFPKQQVYTDNTAQMA